MQDWLRKKQYPFSSTLKKKDLYVLVKIHKPRFPKYKTDELARSYGHEILRLPPYHCEFNPTELIWARSTKRIRSKAQQNIQNCRYSKVI